MIEVFYLNRLQTQFAGAFEVQLPVINHHARGGLPLHDFHHTPVNLNIRFADAEVTRTEKYFEIIFQLKLLDAVFVDFSRLIIERGHDVFAGGRNLPAKFKRLWKWLRLREHEGLEVFRLVVPRPVEHGALYVLIESCLPDLKGVEHQLVAIGEIVPVEMKFLGRSFSRFAVPTVRENHAAIVPEQRLYLSHAAQSAWLSARLSILRTPAGGPGTPTATAPITLAPRRLRNNKRMSRPSPGI